MLAGDQKSSLQSGDSKRSGRSRVSRRTQFNTTEMKVRSVIEKEKEEEEKEEEKEEEEEEKEEEYLQFVRQHHYSR